MTKYFILLFLVPCLFCMAAGLFVSCLFGLPIIFGLSFFTSDKPFHDTAFIFVDIIKMPFAVTNHFIQIFWSPQ